MRITVKETVTRENQDVDRVYTDGDTVFVTPDGVGRFFYDSVDEAIEQQLDPVVAVVEVEHIED